MIAFWLIIARGEQGPTESNVALAEVTGVYWRYAHVAANSMRKSCHPDLNHRQLTQINCGELFSIGSQRLACSSSSATQVQNTIEIATLTPAFFNSRFPN